MIFYQRLLALDQQDAQNVLETLGKDQPLITVFDEIVIPALAMAERDRHTGQLDAKREDFIVKASTNSSRSWPKPSPRPATGNPVPPASSAFRRTMQPTKSPPPCAPFPPQEGFPAIAFPVTDSPGELIHNLGAQARRRGVHFRCAPFRFR